MDETPIQDSAAGRFVLVLEDSNGDINIAGVQKPEQFDPTLASHLIGRWLSENIEMVCRLARAAQLEREQKGLGQEAAAGRGDPNAPAIITGDRERTIVGTGPAVIYTGNAA